jgi:hypothetical protein
MCERFICGDDLTDNDLADYDNGILVPWRIAADGTQWFRRAGPSMIHAVPADRLTADDSDDDGVLDADDDDDEDPVADQAEVEGFAPINFEFGEGVGDDLDD